MEIQSCHLREEQTRMRSPAIGSRLCAAALLWLALAPNAAIAAPLAKDACDALKTEQNALAATGIRAEMARGVVWAKANVTADKMKSIQRLIEVDEQILFRCAPVRAAAGPDGDDGKDGKDAVPQPKTKPAPKPKAAKPADTAAAAEAEPGPGQDGAFKPDLSEASASPKKGEAPAAKNKATAANAKPKPKPNPKLTPKIEAAHDAFVPPEAVPKSVLKAPEGASPSGAQ